MQMSVKRTVASKELFTALAQKWPKYSPALETEPRLLSSGWANSNYEVQLSGWGSALLRITDNKTAHEMDTILAALTSLKAAGFKTSYPLPDFQAEPPYVIADQSKQSVALYMTFIPGPVPDSYDAAKARELGAAVAAIGQVPVSEALARALPVAPMGTDIMTLLESSELAPEHANSEFGEDCLSKLPDFRRLEADKALPKGLVHGDVFPDNTILEKDSGEVFVIDFEEVCYNVLVLDLAMTLAGCAFGADGEWRREVAAAVVAGYQSVRALEPAEVEALKTAFDYACYSVGFWRWRQWNVLEPDAALAGRWKEIVDKAAAISEAELRGLVE